jgi:hypothetical protein
VDEVCRVFLVAQKVQAPGAGDAGPGFPARPTVALLRGGPRAGDGSGYAPGSPARPLGAPASSRDRHTPLQPGVTAPDNWNST